MARTRELALPRRSQPQGVVRIVEHGCTACFVGSAHGLSTDHRLALAADGIGVGHAGPQLVYDGSKTMLADSSVAVPTGGEFTLILYLTSNVASGTASISVGNAMGMGAAEFSVFAPYIVDGRTYFHWGGTNEGNGGISASAGGVATGVWLMSAGPDGMQIWRDGALLAQNSSNLSRSASSEPLFTRPGGGSGAWSSPLLAMFGRQFDRGWNQSTSANPWRVFAPLTRRVPLPAAAPSGVQDITAVIAESILSDRVSYRATLNYA